MPLVMVLNGKKPMVGVLGFIGMVLKILENLQTVYLTLAKSWD
jgi:hypothetical protein